MHNLRPLKGFANILIILSWIVATAGVIGGIVLAVQEEEMGFRTTKPHVAEGISMAAGSVFLAALFCVVGYWALAWADTTQATETRRLNEEMRQRDLARRAVPPPPTR